jgi:hypothetical protein
VRPWMSIVFRVLSVVIAAGLLASCDRVTMWRNRDLAFSYTGDDTGSVERASVDSDSRVIASAKRVGTRATTDPAVTEIDVDETHFIRGTLNVVYTGRIVFHCRTGEAWCQRVREVATSGSRPRDVFRKWPSRLDAPLKGYPL